jgi:hypothetical protein
MASREVASRDFGDTSAATSSTTGPTLAPQREQNAEPSFNCEPHLVQNTVTPPIADRTDLPDTAPLPSVQRDFSAWPFVEDDIGLEFRVSNENVVRGPV